MGKSNEPVVVQAEFSQDAASGEWIAVSLTHRVSARGMQVRQVRDSLTAQLSERLGKAVQIEEKVKLSKALAAELETFQKNVELEKKLQASREATLVPLAKKLLRERLQMQQVAAMLRVSKAWLGQVLKKDAEESLGD